MPTETLAEHLDALTAATLEARFGARIVERGRAYFAHHNVAALSVGPGLVRARVLGTATYTVEIRPAHGEPLAVCDCPYQGECKHTVAVLLELRERTRPERVALFDAAPEEDPFVRYLAALDADELRRTLLAVAPDYLREAVRNPGTSAEATALSARFRQTVQDYNAPPGQQHTLAAHLLELQRFVRAEPLLAEELLGEAIAQLRAGEWLWRE